MPKPGGLLIVTDPDATREHTEYETHSCGHCGYIIVIARGEAPDKMGDLCRRCMRYICVRCATPGYTCTPLLKRIEAQEKAFESKRRVGEWLAPHPRI
jgi:hypothetical protein